MPDQESRELVIIRRNIDGADEGGHSGVWKIAFADFMTAMMAFFLVMWLISANEKTRATIARYFNPIKFQETTPNRKGLRDPVDIETKTLPKGDAANHPSRTKPADEARGARKRAVDSKRPTSTTTADVAAATQNGPSKKAPSPLSQITAEVAGRPASSPLAPRTTPSAAKRATNTGDAFRDPFAPSSQLSAVRPASSQPPVLRPSPSPPPRVGPVNPKPQSTVSNGRPPDAPIPKMRPINSRLVEPPRQLARQAARTAASKLRAEIAGALKDDLASQPGPGIEVRVTNEGTLVSLMDKTGFEMFAVGSAQPQPRAVEMMKKVGRILKAHAGSVVIRGYTDGRAYKSTTYDNWRLSADRADVARDMLVAGGLDEKRVQRIEGFADRQLKKPDDPYAAENRRIEILLKDVKP